MNTTMLQGGQIFIFRSLQSLWTCNDLSIVSNGNESIPFPQCNVIERCSPVGTRGHCTWELVVVVIYGFRSTEIRTDSKENQRSQINMPLPMLDIWYRCSKSMTFIERDDRIALPNTANNSFLDRTTHRFFSNPCTWPTNLKPKVRSWTKILSSIK